MKLLVCGCVGDITYLYWMWSSWVFCWHQFLHPIYIHKNFCVWPFIFKKHTHHVCKFVWNRPIFLHPTQPFLCLVIHIYHTVTISVSLCALGLCGYVLCIHTTPCVSLVILIYHTLTTCVSLCALWVARYGCFLYRRFVCSCNTWLW